MISYVVRQRVPRGKEANPPGMSPLVRPLPPRPFRD